MKETDKTHINELMKEFKVTGIGTCRDPARIPIIMKLVEDLWKKCPDMRLGQFLGNCFSSELKLYYAEEDVLAEKLMSMYGEKDSQGLLGQ